MGDLWLGAFNFADDIFARTYFCSFTLHDAPEKIMKPFRCPVGYSGEICAENNGHGSRQRHQLAVAIG